MEELKKKSNKYNYYLNYAKNIGYYNNNDLFNFERNKLEVLENFLIEFNLKNWSHIIGRNQNGILAFYNTFYKKHMILINDDYITLALSSLFKKHDNYFKSLMFEKILFGNYYLNMICIDKHFFYPNELKDIIENKPYELLEKIVIFDEKDINNCNEIYEFIYLPSKFLILTAIKHLKYAELLCDNKGDFIKFFAFQEYYNSLSNKVANYYLNISSSINELLLKNNFDYQSKEIEKGIFISYKNSQSFFNFLNNKAIKYRIIEKYLIQFITQNIKNNILIEYAELDKYYENQKDKIEKLYYVIIKDNN